MPGRRRPFCGGRENASLAGPKDSSACDLDLSWMEEYTSDGGDLYQLALENLEERESFSYIRRGRMSGDFSGFQELEFAESAEMTGYGTDKASGGGRYQQTGGSGAVDYTFTYAWPRLEKQYKDPYPGQETEERELVNFSLPFYSAVVRTEQGEDGTTVYTADYSGKNFVGCEPGAVKLRAPGRLQDLLGPGRARRPQREWREPW